MTPICRALDGRRGTAVMAAAVLWISAAPQAEAAAKVPASAVGDFAPKVFLHPQEEYRPMDPLTFISRSELRWTHDGKCSDKGFKKAPDPKTLKDGTYVHRKRTSWPRCNPEGQEFGSNHYTRPKSEGNATGDEGFFLDLDNDARKSKGAAAPVVYDVREQERAIVYWLFYGYSDAALNFNHEGDWETVTVFLGTNNKPAKVVYFGHGEPCQIKSNGTRPVAYSALGTHASYPQAGYYELDYNHVDETAAGDTWTTGATLVPLRSQPWYGYGGGWGEVGAWADTTGPLGPYSSFKTGIPKTTPATCKPPAKLRPPG